MGVAEFIKNRFIGEKLYIFCGGIAETITYNQSWATNHELLFGVIVNVDDDVLIMDIPENGTIYVNCHKITCFWEPGIDFHRAVQTSLTKRIGGAKRKDK
jgi:hypothetical protein